MDWKSVQFDWNRARAFLVTAEEGSLSGAARALKMAQPTLGRQVTALEDELGLALFERVGNRLSLTPGGRELLAHARAMGTAATRMSLAATGQSQAIEGRIAISATDVFSSFLLPPIMAGIRASYPGLQISIVASDSITDLRRREADIAIRNTRPQDPELIAKKLYDDRGNLFAATRYLERVGRPKSLADLSRLDFIGWEATEQMIAFMGGRGIKIAQENFVLTSENQLVQWQMIKAGMGVGLMTERVGEEEPLVETVLPDVDPIEYPVWLVAHRDLMTSRRVRLVFDRLAEELHP
ncbi:MAG: LysR family transcriptional regulator [Pseudomonadota bacterium]